LVGASWTRIQSHSCSAITSSTDGLPEQLQRASERSQGATVFAYHVKDPERYGVVHYDEKGRALRIEEKPSRPKSS